MNAKILKFAEAHPVGFLRYPRKLAAPLRAVKKFIAPAEVQSRGLCTRTEDQGSTSQCAAYSATQFAESINWSNKHYWDEIDPAKIYARAKETDGDPDGDGTTLNDALEAILYYKYIDPTDCKVVNVNYNNLKFALHSYGRIVGGFNITEDWYAPKQGVISTTTGGSLGGHAVFVVGYNRDGIFIQNSWGESWGKNGFALVSWDVVKKQYIYGAVIKGCLKPE